MTDPSTSDAHPRPLLLGHRGARAMRAIRENTPESFDRALADGCDGFEFDVRLTVDGQAVVWHDPELGGIQIGEASACELPQLSLLGQLLARYHNRAFLDIELKVAGLEKMVAELLRKFSPHQGFVVSSFLPEVLRTIHAEDSVIPLGLICETTAELGHWGRLPIDYVIPHHSLLNKILISDIKAAGKKILVWTVNDPAQMQRIRDSGVDGIISDDTALLCRTLSV